MDLTVRLTGFQPFGDHAVNPSQVLVGSLLGTTHELNLDALGPFGVESTVARVRFIGEILTVDEAGSRVSTTAIDGVDAVMHVGLKETATELHLEMCAINENTFRIPDNSGRQLRESFIEESGLALLHCTGHRPSFEILAGRESALVISEDCGRFVCNETYYRTLHAIDAGGVQVRGRALPALFLHIPPFESVPESRQRELLLEIAARLALKPTIAVVGGVVVREDGRMLACRRAPEEAMGGWWEFPGGKIDPDETEPQALTREMREELGLEVEVGTLLGRHSHDYGAMRVNLAFYACTADGQTPTLRVHDASCWVSEAEVGSLEWLPPDVDFVNRLAAEGFDALRDQSESV